MAQFAANTSVSVEKSQSEIRKIVNAYGASQFMAGDDMARGRSLIEFYCRERRIRFVISLPKKDEKRFWYSPGRPHVRRSPVAAEEAWEQSCRTKWRALCLCIKAKLEAVQSEISLFEEEFLAHTVMPDGKTVAEMALPFVAEAYKLGQMPEGVAGMLGFKGPDNSNA